MRSLRSLSLLLLSSLAYTSPLPDAGAETNALVDRSAHPRLFTVQSFQLAQPSGSGLTGYYLTTSKNGGLILQNTAPNPATVLYVDTDAKAFLVRLTSLVFSSLLYHYPLFPPPQNLVQQPLTLLTRRPAPQRQSTSTPSRAPSRARGTSRTRP